MSTIWLALFLSRLHYFLWIVICFCISAIEIRFLLFGLFDNELCWVRAVFLIFETDCEVFGLYNLGFLSNPYVWKVVCFGLFYFELPNMFSGIYDLSMLTLFACISSYIFISSSSTEGISIFSILDYSANKASLISGLDISGIRFVL